MKLAPEEALVAATANAAHVLGRGDRIGRLRPGFDADIVLLDAPDWRHVAYHLARRRRPHRRRRRSGGVQADGIIPGMATQKQRRRRAKEKRHDYDLVYVDEDGVEQVVERDEPRKPPAKAGGTSGQATKTAEQEHERPPRPRGAAALVAQGARSAGRSSPRSSSPR